LLAAGAVVWFLHTAWFPIVSRAIRQLPPQGELHAGWLDWSGDSPQTLAENRFLALTIDLQHEGSARSPSHLQLEFGRRDLQVLSLFGSAKVTYPARRSVAANRPELEPWWGAWAPPLLALVALGVIAALMASWALLATVYCLPAWLMALFANRHLDWSGSWRLAGAALLPGALWMTAAIVLYGSGILDLVQWLIATAAHFVVGWVYLGLSPWWLPRHPDVLTSHPNPFNKSKAPPSLTHN
jgi:hypothetical protein